MINKQRLSHRLGVVQKRIDRLKVHLKDPKRARNFPARNRLRTFIDERAEILAALGTTATETNTE